MSAADVRIPDPYSIPLDAIDMSQPLLFQRDVHARYFERLRKEAPVPYCRDSLFGPFWRVTRFKDIMPADPQHKVFSSEGGTTLGPPVAGQEPQLMPTPMFIAMDPPKHDVQ